jgi:hypothetical protein
MKIYGNKPTRHPSIDGAMLVELANPGDIALGSVTVGTVSIGNIPAVTVNSMPAITVGTVSVGNIPTVIVQSIPSISGTISILGMIGTVSVGGTPPFEISKVTAAKLWPTLQILRSLTLASGGVDYPFNKAIGATTKYVSLLCANIAQVAMGATTNGSTGLMLGAGVPALLPVVYTNGGAADVIHAQSATAASVIYCTEMSD